MKLILKPTYLLITSLLLWSQFLYASADPYKHRSLYVNKFNQILESEQQQQQLFAFIRQHQITELILYDLHLVNQKYPLTKYSENQILANFIRKAKTKYGLKKLSAAGESGDFFLKVIHPYNRSRKDSLERFDIYNLEYEYWNKSQSDPGGYYCTSYLEKNQMPCDRASSFQFFIKSLEIVRALADELEKKVLVEAYIGHFKEAEVKQICTHVDRLLVHDYVKREAYLFPYVEKRLHLLERERPHIQVSILYSLESRYLGPYLKRHDFHLAEKKFFEELKAVDQDLDKHLKLRGFTYFHYDHFRNAENISSP